MTNILFLDVGSGSPLSRPHKSSALGAGIISGAGSLIGGLFSSGGSHYAARKQLQYRDWETDRKSTRLNSSHRSLSRMPSSA